MDQIKPRALKETISASIVYYNNEDYLERVLVRVLPAFRSANVKLFLVDNASTDGTSAILDRYVAPEDPWVTRIRSPLNVGFGRAHNLVLDHLHSNYHLICNPDIVFEDASTLCECVSFMEQQPDVGLTTVKLLNPDGTLQAANKMYPNILDLFLRRFCSRTRWEFLRRRMAHYEMRDVGYDTVIDVPFVNGAFMMVRTELLHAVEGFDPRFFLYFEDADLSRKIQKTHRTVYYPNASVVHFWERSSHKHIHMGLILIENGIRYFNKWGWKLS